MKTVKKIICGLLCFVIAVSLVMAMVVYVRNNKDDGYTKTIVYLGDSLSEGILGSSPFSERDSYCYYSIIGRSNNYRYIESSVSGDTTLLLHRRLTATDTPSLVRQYHVTQADIIHVSILGNDLLGGNIGQTAIEAVQGNYARINTMLDRASEYFGLSIERIKELNPDAVILVNTLYNPLDAASTLLSQAQKDDLIELADGDSSIIRIAGVDLLTRLNAIVYDYLEEHPDAYEIVDVYTAFNQRYNEDYDEGIALFYGDWLHPSNEGHALITHLLQDKLVELGLADYDYALSRYKVLRIEQLERLFTNTTVNIDSVTTAIAEADSFEEVTRAYFPSIRGVTPLYTGKPITLRKGEIFSETKEYHLDSLTMGADDFAAFLDKEQSVFTYRTDGTFSMKLVPDEMMLGLANIALYQATLHGGLDLSESLGKGNFDTGIEVYLSSVFPGLDFHYFDQILELLSSVGVYLNGIDFEDENIIMLQDSMEESMTIPQGFVLPDNLSIEIKGNYFVEQEGEFTNIHMCVGNVSQDGYPFLYATMHTEADGSTWIETAIEVSKITVTAK